MKEDVQAQEAAMKALMAKRGPPTELLWMYLRWNTTNSTWEEDKGKEHMTTTILEGLLLTLQTVIQANSVIVKFHSTRPLAAEHRSVVIFLLAHRTLVALCGNGAVRINAAR